MTTMRRLLALLVILLALSAPARAQDAIDLHTVRVLGGSPTDVADWAPTATLTQIDVHARGECCFAFEFTKKEGPGRWPDVTPPGWDGPVQFTAWAIFEVNGQRVTAGAVEYWHGKERSGGEPSQLADHWYYHVPEMAHHQPAPGERVWFFLTAGDQRVKDVHAVRERSNVVAVAFPTDAGETFTFTGPPPVITPPVVTPPVVQPPVIIVTPPAQPEGVLLAQLAALNLKVDLLTAKVDENGRAAGDAHASLNANLNEHRAAVRTEWERYKPILIFITKYGSIIAGTVYATTQVKK